MPDPYLNRSSQRPWAESFLDAWNANPANAGRKPRIGLSRLVFPAKDRATARAPLAALI